MQRFQKKNWARPRKAAKTAEAAPIPGMVQTVSRRGSLPLNGYYLSQEPVYALYDALREGVPIIDASLLKIIRLVGGYTITCGGGAAEHALNRFLRNVPVGGVGQGLEAFLCTYLDNLLAYGSAIGEIVPDRSGRHIAGLYNGSLRDVAVRPGRNPLEADIFIRQEGRLLPVPERRLILFSALNPRPGEVMGCSLLSGLPFVSKILLTIYDAMGQNFERCGNIRYAVTYRPSADGADRAFAADRARQIAKEWGEGMDAARRGNVTDFVSVGDVDIRVIGADSRMIETQIPVRQMLEEIIAKLGVPPFLLGLSWSTTERMSKQQADILASELAHYRRLLTPMILKICETWLRLEGYSGEPKLAWDALNLQDESEIARARLYQAQANKINRELEVSQ